MLDTEPDPVATKLLVSQCGGDPGAVVRRLTAHDSRVSRKILFKIQKRRRGRASSGALREVLFRRKWSLHRHVHLVAAFEEVHAEAPLRSVLTAGCGAGVSEMFLAARHPEVQFTLTDYDDERLAAARLTAQNLVLPNVTFRTLDLLSEPGPERFDLVTSTEVLEHIEPDGVAARHMAAVASRAVWALVPFCRARDLDRPDLKQRAWEAHGHHRIGYTAESLAALFPDDRHQWVRNCYYEPEAPDLRARLNESDNHQLLQQYPELVAAAVSDVRDEPRPDGGAAGIEILVRRDR